MSTPSHTHRFNLPRNAVLIDEMDTTENPSSPNYGRLDERIRLTLLDAMINNDIQ